MDDVNNVKGSKNVVFICDWRIPLPMKLEFVCESCVTDDNGMALGAHRAK